MRSNFIRSKLLQLIVIAMAVFGLVSAITVPPFAKPDENLHYLKAVAVSQGHFFCQVNSDGPVNPVSAAVYQFVYPAEAAEVLAANPGQKVFNEPLSCVLPFLFYLLPAAVIWLFSKLGFTLAVTFLFGRVANFVVSFGLVLLSVRGLPFRWKLLSLYTLALPMTLYQLSSYSKDVVHLALGLVLINRVLKFLLFKTIPHWEKWMLWLVAMVFVLSRPQYIWYLGFLALLPGLLNGDSISKLLGRKSLQLAGVFGVVGAVLMSLISRNVYLSPFNKNEEVVFYQQIDPVLQVQGIIHAPGIFLVALGQSFYSQWSFYVKSTIGILGKLDQPLPDAVYVLYILLAFGVVVLVSRTSQIAEMRSKIRWMQALGSLTLVSLFFAMYLYSSPVGAETIQGVQGRYFLLLVPIALLGAARVLSHLWPAKSRYDTDSEHSLDPILEQ